jgi:esterase/lipase superfamily enzyme
MPIRYFATNRDRENLGRDLNRKDRILLQKGGYHWVDMECYMSHYLATTDLRSMPVEAVIQNSHEVVFVPFLLRPAVKHIVIGIHGFNSPLHGALTTFSMLADTLVTNAGMGKLVVDPFSKAAAQIDLDDPNETVTAMIGFSWPSNGLMLDYESDRTEVVSSAPALANLIGRIHYRKPGVKVHVIAHSMGNFLICQMLKQLVYKETTPMAVVDGEIKPLEDHQALIERMLRRRDEVGDKDFFVDRLIMLAPDVERRQVTQCNTGTSLNSTAAYLGPFYPGLYHLVEKVHLFYSRFDEALKASRVEKEVREKVGKIREIFAGHDPENLWENSLGLNPAPSLAPPNLISHNAVALSNRAIGHSDYMDAPAIAQKIAEVIYEMD